MTGLTPSHPRPWYCIDQLVDDYRIVLQHNSDFRMLRALKLIRSILVIMSVASISLYSLHLGAEPTIVAIAALPTLAAYAGAEAIDYGALLQAYREAQGD